MSRIRSIKPEFWTSEQILECSTNARLLFIGLWNFCDDAGRHPYSAKQAKAEVFPADDFTEEQMAGMLQELSTNGLIIRYASGGKEYFYVPGWKHQRIDKPHLPKYPDPFAEGSTIIPRTLQEYSTTIPGTIPPDRIGKDKIGKERIGEDKDPTADAVESESKKDSPSPKIVSLPATNSKPKKEYAFAGAVIKLNEADYRALAAAAHTVDLHAELFGLDAYYAKEGVTDWFHRARNAVLKIHRENIKEQRPTRREAGLDW